MRPSNRHRYQHYVETTDPVRCHQLFTYIYRSLYPVQVHSSRKYTIRLCRSFREGTRVKSTRPKIVVLGGGFGGLEAALSLRLRVRDNAEITMISDRDYFLFKPNAIYIPFG